MSDVVSNSNLNINGGNTNVPFTSQFGGMFKSSPAGIKIGIDNSANGHLWVGWITEIILYNCILTSGEIARKRAEIAAYYGITLA